MPEFYFVVECFLALAHARLITEGDTRRHRGILNTKTEVTSTPVDLMSTAPRGFETTVHHASF